MPKRALCGVNPAAQFFSTILLVIGSASSEVINMLSFVIATLVGCAPTPDSVKFEGDVNAKVYSADAIPTLKVSVMDKEKKAITPAPELAWTVGPADCAKLDGNNIKPVKDAGLCTAKVDVAVKGTQVKGTYNVVIAIANKLEIAGYTAGNKLATGSSLDLTANVMADTEAVKDAKVDWTSSDANIVKVENGKVTAVGADGTKATITATSGKATASVDVEVGPAAPATADAAGAPPAPTK
jgi:hypothetical protein